MVNEIDAPVLDFTSFSRSCRVLLMVNNSFLVVIGFLRFRFWGSQYEAGFQRNSGSQLLIGFHFPFGSQAEAGFHCKDGSRLFPFQ